jgi:elongation factor G
LYFVDKIVGGTVPREYIPAVEDGFREATKKGAKYKFPFVDIEATLLDGKHHEVDSSWQAFQTCSFSPSRKRSRKRGSCSWSRS